MNLGVEYLSQWIIDLMIGMEEHKMKKPYIDTKLSENEWIREFDPSISESEEYVWHRDTRDRTVLVLDGEGWKFQFDEELPQIINKGKELKIPKLVYHRLVPGSTNLKIKITET
jgi:quercetin dioxygenase-like cupin family protein